MEPRVQQMELPAEYGTPTKLLGWADVCKDLEEAPVYWIATTRPDGRPHVVPRDGIWLNNAWYYGGSDETVHNRNLLQNPSVTMHIGDGMKAIIVEGIAEYVKPDHQTATRLAEINNVKYAHYGMNATAKTYTSGVWSLRPKRILAWNMLFEDATRFTF